MPDIEAHPKRACSGLFFEFSTRFQLEVGVIRQRHIYMLESLHNREEQEFIERHSREVERRGSQSGIQSELEAAPEPLRRFRPLQRDSA